MYTILFYQKNGKSEIIDYLEELKKKSENSKPDRILRDKILAYINILAINGTRAGTPFVKHIEGDIWELRPSNNRIFFFYWRDNQYILLHYFIKKTPKTPKSEIIKAKNILKDFLERSDKNA